MNDSLLSVTRYIHNVFLRAEREVPFFAPVPWTDFPVLNQEAECKFVQMVWRMRDNPPEILTRGNHVITVDEIIDNIFPEYVGYLIGKGWKNGAPDNLKKTAPFIPQWSPESDQPIPRGKIEEITPGDRELIKILVAMALEAY